MSPRLKREYAVPVEATLDIIGGKWKTLILYFLNDGPKRTNELKKGIPNITQKMLVQQLRELEEDGVIIRTVYNQVPPKVEYELNGLGKSLTVILDHMCDWGERYIRGELGGDPSCAVDVTPSCGVGMQPYPS